MVVFIGLYAGAIISSEYRKFKDKKKGNNNIVEAPKEDDIKENYNNINNKNGPVGSNLGDRGAIIENGNSYRPADPLDIATFRGDIVSPADGGFGSYYGGGFSRFDEVSIVMHFMGKFGML